MPPSLRRGAISPSRRGRVPRLGETAQTSGDILLPHYGSIHSTYMGKQRKGHFEPIKEAANHLRCIQKAIDLECALWSKMPLPEQTQEAYKFITSSPPGSIMEFWTKKLARLDTMLAQAATAQKQWQHAQKQWQQQTPGFIIRAKGEIKPLQSRNFLFDTTWGAELGYNNSYSGAPIVRILYQNGGFFRGRRTGHCPTQPQQRWVESKDRFLGRPAHSGYKNAQRLWGDALVHVCVGWLGG